MMTRYNWLVIAMIISLVMTGFYMNQNLSHFINPLGW